jgi:hypothetical protein
MGAGLLNDITFVGLGVKATIAVAVAEGHAMVR